MYSTMMNRFLPFFALLLFRLIGCRGFVPVHQRTTRVLAAAAAAAATAGRINKKTVLFSSTAAPSPGAGTKRDDGSDVAAIRADIERIKEEARLLRLEAAAIAGEKDKAATADAVGSPKDATVTAAAPGFSSTATATAASLDNTRWRLMINIGGGKEGIAMSTQKSWADKNVRFQKRIKQNEMIANLEGNDAMRLQLEVVFTDEPFFGKSQKPGEGYKVLRAVRNEAFVSGDPTARRNKVRIGDGGWRVLPTGGPLGTPLLRFDFDLEEEETYFPSKVRDCRVYCTCGYFPVNGGDASLDNNAAALASSVATDEDGEGVVSAKEEYQRELSELEDKFYELQTDDSLSFFEVMKRKKTMLNIRIRAMDIKEKIRQESIKTPELSSLRLSRIAAGGRDNRRGDEPAVGLTQAGDVFCVKNKNKGQPWQQQQQQNEASSSINNDYHAVGTFHIASMDNRDRNAYRDLLLP